jgi:hypothetical protein
MPDTPPHGAETASGQSEIAHDAFPDLRRVELGSPRSATETEGVQP